jgi:2-polyprenyl-3-methyl-5-hydroxy-6-metoxy-1,4-benzoquinol methylase
MIPEIINSDRKIENINRKEMKCRICNESGNHAIYEVKEMMFGFRDRFTYFQCAACKCLQIESFPVDIAKYYPSSYYSFQLPASIAPVGKLRKIIKKVRDRYAVFNEGVLGKLIYKFYPNETLRILSHLGITENSKILDVGCGTGSLLVNLNQIGLRHLQGIDPFINSGIDYGAGLRILKKSIHEAEGKWDVIMFHHAFEHIPDPTETLRSALRLLSENGICLIRVPTVSSYAWEHYKESWVQLDAPRHFFIHSIESITFLARMTGFSLEKVIYDSTDFQFWGSEQYLKDMPLATSDSNVLRPSNSLFSKAEMTSFKQRAKELNKKNQGDSCAFILRKNSTMK